MIEDIIAQAHVLVDSLSFDDGVVALSALRTISDSQENEAHGGPYARLLGVRFQEFGNGRCTASLDVRHHLLNPLNIAHGGVTYSLADFVCGGAALSALGKPQMVTQDMQMRYHGPARAGVITATAETLHHGRRTITVQYRVTQNEVLIASGTATFAILAEAELRQLGAGTAG
jgi:acyl-CoA thioesterase